MLLRRVRLADRGDGDLDGNTEELVPRRDAAGLLVYAPDLARWRTFATRASPCSPGWTSA